MNLHLKATVLPEGEKRDIWVVDGTISYTPVPDAQTVLDGGYLLPGLVDAHCHISLEDLGAAPRQTSITHAIQDRNAGTLLIREAGAPDDTHWVDDDPDLPRIIRAGRWIARPMRYLKGYAVEIEPEELVAEVAKQVENSDGWVKIVGDWIDRQYGDLTPLWPDDIAAAAIKEAHRLGAKMTAHCFGEESVAQLVRAGIDCIEHGTGADTSTLKIMADKQIPIIPTMTNLENFPTFAAAGQAKFPTYAAHMRALYSRRFDTMREAYELGVPLYAGTDAGGMVPHGLIAGEVKLMAEISNNDFALGAASWNAREWLGVPSTLAQGNPADFVAYAADPRENLGVLEHPEFVVLRGRIHN